MAGYGGGRPHIKGISEKKQSVHLRLFPSAWKEIDEWCEKRKIKKQVLFDIFAHAVINTDKRIEELLVEALGDRKKIKGLDKLDIVELQKVLAEQGDI